MGPDYNNALVLHHNVLMFDLLIFLLTLHKSTVYLLQPLEFVEKKVVRIITLNRPRREGGGK